MTRNISGGDSISGVVFLPCDQSCSDGMYPFDDIACSCSSVNRTEKYAKGNAFLHEGEARCTPQEHVLYMKTFKTASSTMVNILYRFALERDLKVLQFTEWNVLHKERLKNHTLDFALQQNPTGKTKKYDMLMDHIIYDKNFVLTHLHPDTQRVTSIRDPWKRLNSHLDFFTRIFPGMEKQLNLDRHRDTPLNVQFMQNLEKHGETYERKLSSEMALFSLRNQMSKQFGITQGLKLNTFLKQIQEEFPHVIIQEYFEESVLLLKRKLCWSMGDILHARLRRRQCLGDSVCHSSANDKEKAFERKFLMWSSADYYLYKALNASFWRSVSLEKNFFTELAYFRHINAQVNEWCHNEVFHVLQKYPGELHRVLKHVTEDVLVISETEYNRRIVIDKLRCLLMRVDGNVWRNIFRFRQFPHLCDLLDTSRFYNPKTFDFAPNESVWGNIHYCDNVSSCCKIPLSVLKYRESFVWNHLFFMRSEQLPFFPAGSSDCMEHAQVVHMSARRLFPWLQLPQQECLTNLVYFLWETSCGSCGVDIYERALNLVLSVWISCCSFRETSVLSFLRKQWVASLSWEKTSFLGNEIFPF